MNVVTLCPGVEKDYLEMTPLNKIQGFRFLEQLLCGCGALVFIIQDSLRTWNLWFNSGHCICVMKWIHPSGTLVATRIIQVKREAHAELFFFNFLFSSGNLHLIALKVQTLCSQDTSPH